MSTDDHTFMRMGPTNACVCGLPEDQHAHQPFEASLLELAQTRILTLEAALRRARDIIEGALLTLDMQEPYPPTDYPAEP